MEENKKENLVREILEHEATKIIGIIVVVYAFITMIILPIKSIEQRLTVIETNHLTHIQNVLNNYENDFKQNTAQHEKIMSELTKTATILDQHLKQK